LWAADLRSSSPPPAGLTAEVREVDAKSAMAIAAVMGGEGNLVSKRLARGCRCFGVWLGREVVGYGWVSAQPEWIGEIELEITPPPGEAYVWNCVTVMEHRRKGIFRELLHSIAARGRVEGMKRLWIGSVAIPAEGAVGAAGFVPALHFETASAWGRRWLRVRPAEADSDLVGAARQALSSGGRPLELGHSFRRVRPRRH
jgi:hypothetical protein